MEQTVHLNGQGIFIMVLSLTSVVALSIFCIIHLLRNKE